MKSDKYSDVIIGDINTFKKFYPKEYAKKLREDFLKNNSLWFERITPAEKARELMQKTRGDFSEVWEDYCVNCFKEINKNTEEPIYLSLDEATCLCEKCYNILIKNRTE